MNFYSDQIINHIIDHEPIDNILDSLDRFNNLCKYILLKYSMHKINHNYTINLLKNPKNIIAFHCLDHEFNIYNCPSILIYRKIPTKTEIKYYILFACTKFAFRGLGYASKLIDGLVDRIKFEKNDTTKIIKIITNSLETACVFYELYGFQWKRNESINDHPILMQNEKYEEDKEYFIFELIL